MLTAFQAAAATATATPAAGTSTSLCVGVAPLQQSTVRGQASQWEVGAWAVGGNLPDAKIQLQSSAGAGIPTFTFGCTAGNGTSACDLGALDASSGQRLFEAEVTVPVTATTLTTLTLMVTGSAADLVSDPAAASAMTVLAPASPVGSSTSLPAMAPPGVAAPTPSLGSGSAADLIPTVAPGSPEAEGETPAASVSALNGNSTPVGSEIAEVAGLAALAVAMVLAITRLSWRRPAPRHAATPAADPPPPPPTAEGQQ